MTLYEELTSKQKRTIARDINEILSMKGLSFPKTIDEIKETGFFSPKIKTNNKEIYLSENGRSALRRICDITHQSKKYKDLLNYNDIFQCILSEIERWFNDELIPNADEFINPLEDLLTDIISKHFFSCKIDGISLKEILNLNIGLREIKNYDGLIFVGVSDINETIKSTIDAEYDNQLIIAGHENGSRSVAMEKFYHNAELSLSILRMYSCALYSQAIHKVNIRLINKCSNAYGPASCFGWKEPSKTLTFQRYFKSVQDFKIDTELLDYLNVELFFNDLSSLIDKSSRNELEDAIVKSLYWTGEAQKDHSRASAWVKLWSALECFFTLGENTITERNARGISSMLVYGGFRLEKHDNYTQTKTKIKKYYKLRSKVVHHAEYSHIDEIQLEEMSSIVAWVIITMVSLLKRGYTQLSEIATEAERLDSIHKK